MERMEKVLFFPRQMSDFFELNCHEYAQACSSCAVIKTDLLRVRPFRFQCSEVAPIYC